MLLSLCINTPNEGYSCQYANSITLKCTAQEVNCQGLAAAGTVHARRQSPVTGRKNDGLSSAKINNADEED
jgi:hypothetical protein